MKEEAIILIVALLVGALAGWSVTDGYHERKADKLLTQQIKAEEKRNEKIGELATFWQAKLDLANSAEPMVVERVHVRVKECAVSAAAVDGVADGAGAGRAELDEAIIRGVERVARQAEQQYRECSHRLRSLQEALGQYKPASLD